MNIMFRVDAGGNIGLGHFYRSVHLAKKLKDKRHNIHFVHQDSLFWDNASVNFDHFAIATEENQLNYIDSLKIDVFYVDSILDFSSAFYKALKHRNCKIIFYQNVSSTRHLCDCFILPSLHQDNSFFQNFSQETEIYQGLEFFTFNEKVLSISPKKGVKKEVEKVAILSGGSDPKDVLRRLFFLLKKLDLGKIECNYFFGNNYIYKNELPVSDENHRFLPFSLEGIVNNDIVLSAFGVSSYECMALRLPVVGVGHQKSNAAASDYLASKGLIFSLGNIDDLTQEAFTKKIEKILASYIERKSVVEQCIKQIDLNGINRIINIIEHE